jgi:hypothetical protein
MELPGNESRKSMYFLATPAMQFSAPDSCLFQVLYLFTRSFDLGFHLQAQRGEA